MNGASWLGSFPKVASFFTNLQGQQDAKLIQALTEKEKCGWLGLETFFK
jgi:hypothetical protein